MRLSAPSPRGREREQGLAGLGAHLLERVADDGDDEVEDRDRREEEEDDLHHERAERQLVEVRVAERRAEEREERAAVRREALGRRARVVVGAAGRHDRVLLEALDAVVHVEPARERRRHRDERGDEVPVFERERGGGLRVIPDDDGALAGPAPRTTRGRA